MTEFARALYAFWNGFGLPAYPEGNVPCEGSVPCGGSVPETDAQGRAVCPPYITYTLEKPDWGATAPHQARIWMSGEGYEAIDAKLDEIAAAIPAGCGALIRAGEGLLWLRRADAWVQMLDTGDRHLKAAQLSMEIRAYVV